MDKNKKKNENKGVVCDVVNCAYHDGASTCYAKQISVGPTGATNCTDTVCATFKLRTDEGMTKG